MSEFILALVVEQCSVAHESQICILQQFLFFVREAAVVAVHVFYSLEEFRVEPHVVGVLGEHWLYFLCQCVHFVVGVGAHEIEECR